MNFDFWSYNVSLFSTSQFLILHMVIAPRTTQLHWFFCYYIRRTLYKLFFFTRFLLSSYFEEWTSGHYSQSAWLIKLLKEKAQCNGLLPFGQHLFATVYQKGSFGWEDLLNGVRACWKEHFVVNNWIVAVSTRVFKCWDRTAPGVCLPEKAPYASYPASLLPQSIAPLLLSNQSDKGYPLQSPSHSSAATD